MGRNVSKGATFRRPHGSGAHMRTASGNLQTARSTRERHAKEYGMTLLRRASRTGLWLESRAQFDRVFHPSRCKSIPVARGRIVDRSGDAHSWQRSDKAIQPLSVRSTRSRWPEGTAVMDIAPYHRSRLRPHEPLVS